MLEIKLLALNLGWGFQNEHRITKLVAYNLLAVHYSPKRKKWRKEVKKVKGRREGIKKEGKEFVKV